MYIPKLKHVNLLNLQKSSKIDLLFSINKINIKFIARKNSDKFLVDGFTFNPTLFKSLGAVNYLSFCEEILGIEKVRPVSLEIISDDYDNTILQAKKLSNLAKNVVVKIIFTEIC